MRGLLAYLMDLTFLFHSLPSTTLFNPFVSIFSLQDSTGPASVVVHLCQWHVEMFYGVMVLLNIY